MMVDRDLETSASPIAHPRSASEVFRVEVTGRVEHPQHAGREVIRQRGASRCAAGEIVGIAGLMGAGRTEFAHERVRPLLGARHHRHAPFMDGKPGGPVHGPAAPLRPGSAYVTGGPQARSGLVLDDDIRKSTSPWPICGGVSSGGIRWIDGTRRCSVKLDRVAAAQDAHTLLLEASRRRSAASPAATSRRSCCPSGCSDGPEVLILDEPTRGIDVGAKYEIYHHHQRAGRGGEGRGRSSRPRCRNCSACATASA